MINWRILHCVHTCSLELLPTLTELTTFQLLPHSVTSCGVSTLLLGAEGVCGLMSCRVLTTRVQEMADQSGKTCTGVTDQDFAGMLQIKLLVLALFSNRARTWRCSGAAWLKLSLTFRGPPRQRQPREDGNEEDKENQGDETQSQQPPQRRYRRNFNYRRRRPENPKPQDGKETKTAEPPAENTSAPEAEQGGAE